ncbi:E3 SUMO-protein ligase NSE2 [Hyperolius riggenbachi]|uniref:E3 SUMO-protein ligase NSE2 n=1 Tax=Hyperolius riggenbachi TaxID=752182 RepID=UPI0035A3A92C
MAGHGAPLISFSSVDTSLSSLKQCQNYIDTGMDIATSVALDLLQSGCDTVDVDCMETVMLEYAAVNRDLNNYIAAVEETIGKLKQNAPEEPPDIKELVNQRYEALQSKNTAEALKKNKKFLQFKEQLRDLKLQMGVSSDDAEAPFEDEDEEIAVTQSIANFTCPITQMEMVDPVKNRACGHTYEKSAIENMITRNRAKGKDTRCPKIGCENIIKAPDLVVDTALKRAIDVHHKKQSH